VGFARALTGVLILIKSTYRTGCSSAEKVAEEDLVEHARNGCLTCKNRLIEQNTVGLRSFVFRMMFSSPEREDIFQQTVVRAIQKFHQFRGDSSFLTWLCSIAVNEKRQLSRRQRILKMYPLEDELGAIPYWHEDRSAREASYNAAKLQSVRRAVETLPPSFKSVVELYEFEGRTLSDIASLLNSTVSAVKSRHFRAKRLLITAMQRRPRKLLEARLRLNLAKPAA